MWSYCQSTLRQMIEGEGRGVAPCPMLPDLSFVRPPQCPRIHSLPHVIGVVHVSLGSRKSDTPCSLAQCFMQATQPVSNNWHPNTELAPLALYMCQAQQAFKIVFNKGKFQATLLELFIWLAQLRGNRWLVTWRIPCHSSSIPHWPVIFLWQRFKTALPQRSSSKHFSCQELSMKHLEVKALAPRVSPLKMHQKQKISRSGENTWTAEFPVGNNVWGKSRQVTLNCNLSPWMVGGLMKSLKREQAKAWNVWGVDRGCFVHAFTAVETGHHRTDPNSTSTCERSTGEKGIDNKGRDRYRPKNSNLPLPL